MDELIFKSFNKPIIKKKLNDVGDLDEAFNEIRRKMF